MPGTKPDEKPKPPYGDDDPPEGDGYRPPGFQPVPETPQEHWIEERKRLKHYW